MVVVIDRGQQFSALLSQIARVNGLVLSAGETLARPVGLTSARWQVLRAVDHGPVTVAQAARVLDLTRQTVRETAASLLSLGLVRQQDNPHDGRARLLTLTPRGRSALRAVERRHAAWANQMAARASLTDLRATTEILRDLGDVLEG
jgi:DNA-binding MarR family transcriptional regulator